MAGEKYRGVIRHGCDGDLAQPPLAEGLSAKRQWMGGFRAWGDGRVTQRLTSVLMVNRNWRFQIGREDTKRCGRMVGLVGAEERVCDGVGGGQR